MLVTLLWPNFGLSTYELGRVTAAMLLLGNGDTVTNRFFAEAHESEDSLCSLLLRQF